MDASSLDAPPTAAAPAPPTSAAARRASLSVPAPSNFSTALSTWKDINLTELQKTLDSQGVEIVDNQKENMVGRKKLAESTREFKKLPEEDKGPAFKGLLKSYQSEIDNLTKRSKTAESAFLSLYKLLAEAPDPYPLLDAAVDQTARASEAKLLESDLVRQRDENQQLKKQLADAQAIEKDKRKLQDRCDKLEAKMEDMIRDKVASKEAELHATYDERLRNYEDREKDLQRQVALARNQLRELRSTHDSSQAKLFQDSEREDQATMARLAEADLVAADLERANSRVAEVERRNETLRAEIEAVRSGAESAERVTTLETQVADLQSEASRLLRSLDSQKEEAASHRADAQRKLDELARTAEARANEAEGLRERVRQFHDYDEIKRELEIMKYVEFAGMSMDDTMDETFDADESFASFGVQLPDPNAIKANKQGGRPLEHLLISKNRKLQSELTSLRVAHDELGASHREAQSGLESVTSRFDEQRRLNERLENDLLRLNKGGSSTSAPRSPALDPVAAVAAKKAPADAASAETSILPIITSQRDRFRQRNSELEDELRRQFETISELRNEIKSLQADNLKLYEKVRYLQSYREDTSSKALGFASTVRGDEELGKYRNKYDERMNPFEAFRGREKDRAVQNLNPIEKLVFQLASVVLANRYMRNVFVVYALGLHLVVLLSLYGWATESPDGPGATAETFNAVPAPPIRR